MRKIYVGNAHALEGTDVFASDIEILSSTDDIQHLLRPVGVTMDPTSYIDHVRESKNKLCLRTDTV